MPPITEQAKLQERNFILAIAKNDGIRVQIIHNLKNKLMLKTKYTKATPTQTQ